MKEGTDHLRASSEAAQGQADVLFENLQMGRTQSGQGVLFHPGPQAFVGVQFWRVGRQAIDAQLVAVFPQRLSRQFRAVGVQPVPEQEDRAGNPAQQVAEEADQFGAADRAPHQTEISLRGERHRRNRREFGPVEAVEQERRLAARSPGLAGRRQQREAALVEKNQRGLQPLRVFFIRGQVCCTQRWMAASSRSRARRAGFCQLQPKRCSRRQT